MKRIGFLFEKIINKENLYKASKNAQKDKKNYKEVITWNKNLDNNILKLYNSLLDENYKVSNYLVFIIKEPKERVISKLPFKDRVVHHAILNILEPIFKRSFISQTYSCIKQRGIHKCLYLIKKDISNIEETKYCLKLDIRKFYPSINNIILKKLLRTKFKDKKLLNLLDIIIDSTKGLPLGDYTSQWLANFYLDKFDYWLKEKKQIKYYYRYCDDLVILKNNKEELHILKKEIQEYLLINLKLELSNYQVFIVNKRGIDFLEYKIYHCYILLRKSIKRNFINMIKKNYNYKSIASYYGWIKHCNGKNLLNKYIKDYRLQS